MIFEILNKKPALTDQKSFILSDSFIKISNLLSPIKLSKFASRMSIYSMKNPKNADIAKEILSNLYHTVRANILLKLIPGI